MMTEASLKCLMGVQMAEKIKLTIVVNGQPTEVEAHEDVLLLIVVEKALEKTGNTGQPPQNWELRNASGVELNLERKVEHYHFEPHTQLFLNLKAGVGG
jgi:hypothetical protein